MKREEIKSLRVRMFGGFSVYYGETELQLGKKITTKPLQLLQILLHAGERGVSRGRLTEKLFGPETEGDVVNNLGVVVWQLRKLLQNSPLPPEDYISVQNGVYRFRASFPAETDTGMLESFAKSAKRLEGEKKIEMWESACSLYRGHFLPELAGEEWADAEGAYYQHLYFEILEKLCTALEEYGEYGKILQFSTGAAKLYPYDEWQLWQLKALTALGKKREALKLYQEVAEIYLEEPGEEPSERMKEYFAQMGSGFYRQEENIDGILEKLQEDRKEGAYRCPYASFVDTYHILERAVERSMRSVCLLLCTITDTAGELLENSEEAGKISEKLERVIRDNLRRGDIYTRYSRDQFLVMMPGISQEDLLTVIRRLDSSFYRKAGNTDVKISYQKNFVLQEKENM